MNWKAALVLASVPFVAAWLQGTPSAASSGDAASVDASSETSATADPTTVEDFSSNAQPVEATQPSQPIAPAGMKLYGGTSEVVKMAQAGVSDDVILAYITNSNARFGVNADQIVYLNDLGVSGTVVTAMMQHDASASSAAAATPAPAPSMPSTLTPATAPGTDYANPPGPTTDDSGAANPPPDSMDPADYAGPYPGDNAGGTGVADDTDYFYNSLQPYGLWVYLPGYGMCWQPTVCLRDHAWRPYFDRGRWLYSDCGWYWQSDYSWGWAAFHYGRWFCDDHRGWVWRPNRVWGPSWVAWRMSDDHCGWAPLPPAAVFVPGVGFRFHNQVVGASFDFGLPAKSFTFIPIERFGDYAPSRYAVAPWETGRIFDESRVLNSVAFQNQRVANLGMDPRLVDERAGVRMRRAFIQETPGRDANGRVQTDHLGRSGGSLVIFRPQLPSAPVWHGTGPSAGGAGAMLPGHGGMTEATGEPRNVWSSPGYSQARPPTVLGPTGVSANQPGAGGDAGTHVHVYHVTHQDPEPAGAVSWSARQAPPLPANHSPNAAPYPPNSMVLEGRRNVSNPEWNSTSAQAPSGPQMHMNRATSTSVYAVTPGTTGYQQTWGNPYYRTPVVAVATPGPATTYVPPAYNYHQSTYTPAPGQAPSYHPAPEPRENYTAPQPRESYSAPQARDTYSAPAPHENYSAPAPSYSSHASSSSQQSSSSSSSSSSGSSRGR